MTEWERVGKELQSRRRDWKWLREGLLAAEPDLKLTEQAVNHWKDRGIPAKHHSRIEKLLGMHRARCLPLTQNIPTLFVYAYTFCVIIHPCQNKTNSGAIAGECPQGWSQVHRLKLY